MRPTKNVPIGKLDEVRARTTVEGLEIKGRGLGTKPGEEPQIVEDHRAWRTRPLWIHWDLNPWIWCLTKEGEEYHFQEFIQENNGSPNDGLGKAQGILNLVDSKEGDGGFCCVPGFHKHLKEYATLTANTQYARQSLVSRSFVNVPQDDPLNKQVKKISLRAGSMVVWNSELPHCNYPNESSKFRINQYLKMFPAKEGFPNTDVRTEILEEMTENIEVTELGRKLFGLEKW
eukprot:TRINITY_DN150_c1_g1_i7.p1 TRINITY_DN150_c1_g1~~TRINITY_DN150_c1_g1_i7.p1  ORF type:complete len:231 (-),score=38.35 TRINITY_DN150_c1_g1_i7:80-772(-)